MAEIINIDGGRGFKTNEQRLLELAKEIRACEEQFLALHINVIESTDPDESEKMRDNESRLRMRYQQLIEERKRLQNS